MAEKTVTSLRIGRAAAELRIARCGCMQARPYDQDRWFDVVYCSPDRRMHDDWIYPESERARNG